MKYTVDIKYDHKVLVTFEVEADNEQQAMEFAYDQFEYYSYCEVRKNKDE